MESTQLYQSISDRNIFEHSDNLKGKPENNRMSVAKGLQFSSLSVKELSKSKEISPVDLKKPYP